MYHRDGIMNVHIHILNNTTHLPSLVLLHGWGFYSHAWPEAWLTALQKKFQVILVDLPGHGEASMRLGEANSVDTHVSTQTEPSLALLETFITQLVSQLPASFHLLGWSLGGQVAIQIASQYPKRVSSLVCLSSNPCFVSSSSHQGMTAELLQQFTHLYATNPDKTLARFCRLQSQGAINSACRAELQQHVQPCEGQLLGLQWLAQLDLRQALSSTPCPALYVFAETDALVPIAVMDNMRLLLPTTQAKQIAIAGCHGLPFEYPVTNKYNHLWAQLMCHWQAIDA